MTREEKIIDATGMYDAVAHDPYRKVKEMSTTHELKTRGLAKAQVD